MQQREFNVGIADLTLTGGLTLTKGNIEIGGSGSGTGSIVLGNTSTIAADGTLDLGGTLVRECRTERSRNFEN